MAEELLDDTASAWSRREAARQRQIMIGKARPEYQRYITRIPPECRSPSQPATPDPRARVSKRLFDRALGEWRRRLHEYDASPWSSWNTRSAHEWPSGPGPPSPSVAVVAPYGDEGLSARVDSPGFTACGVSRHRRQRPDGMAAHAERAGRLSTGKRGPREKCFDTDELCSPNGESESLVRDPLEAPTQVVCLRLADQLPEVFAQTPFPGNIQMETFDMNQYAACTGPCAWALQYADHMPDLAWNPETPQKSPLMPAVPICGPDDFLHMQAETPQDVQKSMLRPRNGMRMMEEWTPQKMVVSHSNQDEDTRTPDIYGYHEGDLEETQDAGTPWESSSTSTDEVAAEISSQTGSWLSPPRLPKSPRTPQKALARSVSPQSSLAATPATGFWVPETPSPERLYSSIVSNGSRSPPRHPIQSCWFSMPQATTWPPQEPTLFNCGMPMLAVEATENETMPALM